MFDKVFDKDLSYFFRFQKLRVASTIRQREPADRSGCMHVSRAKVHLRSVFVGVRCGGENVLNRVSSTLVLGHICCLSFEFLPNS